MCIKLEGFTNEIGKHFDNINDIHFHNVSEIALELGDPIIRSNIPGTNQGIMIYRSILDPNKALRVDKNYINYRELNRRDDEMISRLQSKQQDVKLTEFPTGVVTIDDKVIGQEIPFYDNSKPLIGLAKDKKIKNWDELLAKYLEMLKILRELLSNGIIYRDVHGGNFMYNYNTGKLNLIDFDEYLVNFDGSERAYNSMISSIKMAIGFMNKFYNRTFESSFDSIYTFEELEEFINERHNRAVRLRQFK